MSTETKATNLIRIPIGDWSYDGHGRVLNYDFIVPVEFTQEILIANYEKNKAEFGFGLNDFVSEYEDYKMPREYFDDLTACGYQHDWGISKRPNSDDEDISIGPNGMSRIAIFFVGHGLDDFSYEVSPKPDFHLFGMWEGPEVGIGYGLFIT